MGGCLNAGFMAPHIMAIKKNVKLSWKKEQIQDFNEQNVYKCI